MRLGTGWIAVVLMAASCLGGDWPRFRGPNGAGIDPMATPPAVFTAEDIAWRTALPGMGHSSPVVIGNKVFITSADAATAERHVLALELGTGKILWDRKYESRPFQQNRDNSYASASCAADGQRVVFSFIVPESYKVYCVDHDGKDLWTYDMGRWQSEHGCGASPILFEDLVIVSNDQTGPTASLVALDAATGKLRWKIDRKAGATAASTPCIFTPKNGPAQIVLTSSASGMTGVEARTGKTLWTAEMNGRLRCVGSVGSSDKYCAAMCGVGGTSRFGVVVEPGADRAEVRHKIPSGAPWPYVPTPVFKGELMFLWSDNGGTVTCLKAATGEKVWQERVGGDYYASPVIAGEKMFNVSKKGEVVCVSASESFKELGRSELGGKSFATPAIVGGRMIFRTEGEVICIGK